MASVSVIDRYRCHLIKYRYRRDKVPISIGWYITYRPIFKTLIRTLIFLFFFFVFQGKYGAMVVCWILGLGSLVSWNSMLTIGDYYYKLFPVSRKLLVSKFPFSSVMNIRFMANNNIVNISNPIFCFCNLYLSKFVRIFFFNWLGLKLNSSSNLFEENPTSLVWVHCSY